MLYVIVDSQIISLKLGLLNRTILTRIKKLLELSNAFSSKPLYIYFYYKLPTVNFIVQTQKDYLIPFCCEMHSVFFGDVIMDSFNMAYMDTDSILDHKYQQNSWSLYYGDFKFRSYRKIGF